MIEQIIVAIVVAVLVGLLLAGLLGPILVQNGAPAPILVTLGNFFVKYGWLLGLLVGLLFLFGGWSVFGFGGHRVLG